MGTLTRTNTCPVCGAVSDLPVVYLFGREILSHLNVYCDDCHAEEARQRAEIAAAQRWAAMLAARMPPRYQTAQAGDVRPEWVAVLSWRGEPSGGLGLVGPSEAGKSSAVACLVRALRWPFLWWSGTEARQSAVDAASSDGDRKGARERWEHGMTIPLLVLDDISQATFTPAWSAALFDLLETRLAHNRATIWTSQATIFKLRGKIEKQNGGDFDQAAAICRRLTQHSIVLSI